MRRGAGRVDKPKSSVEKHRRCDDAVVGGMKSFSLETARESNGYIPARENPEEQ
jgi:hypothetical protein